MFPSAGPPAGPRGKVSHLSYESYLAPPRRRILTAYSNGPSNDPSNDPSNGPSNATRQTTDAPARRRGTGRPARRGQLPSLTTLDRIDQLRLQRERAAGTPFSPSSPPIWVIPLSRGLLLLAGAGLLLSLAAVAAYVPVTDGAVAPQVMLALALASSLCCSLPAALALSRTRRKRFRAVW